MIPKLVLILAIAAVLVWILKSGVDRVVDNSQDNLVTQVSPESRPTPTPTYALLPAPTRTLVPAPTSTPIPTVIPTPTALPTATLTPAPTPTPPADRQFEVGDRVRWLVGGGWVAEGVVESYRIDEPGYWEYEVLRNNGQLWH
jgi:hypothetical protein